MASIEYRPDRPKRYRARYWGPDGKLHSRSFARKDDAQRWLTSEEASKLKGTWIDPSRSRQLFHAWADEWWAVWSSNPRRSPTTLEATENRLRLHVRPEFGRHALRAISVRMVQQWQDKLEATLGHESVMACRSILNRILQAAEDERLIPFNPLRKVKAPRRAVDPEVVFGRVQRRTFSPQEFGRLLAACPPFFRDHFVVHVGTGLRSGELLGLRAYRVALERRRIEVVEVRYDAGRFGSGYKDRPKSDASIRLVPLGDPVAEALARRLDGCPPDGLVFSGPGGGNQIPRGTRTQLSIGNYRRIYDRAAARANLTGLDLHGPHDLRHTFATWLEDGGIPARVIDELMGHHASRSQDQRGSTIGLRYRHMTPAMQARVVTVIEQFMATALADMPQVCPKTGEPDSEKEAEPGPHRG
jgi:integrase